MSADLQQLRFLESIENLKPRVERRFGRRPSTQVAREIVACLLQGRLFYEAAASAPLEIRPLQLFYGMVGFAKALIIASGCRSIATLASSHGLKDVSDDGCRIADMKVAVTNAGTFHEFNDVVASNTRYCFHTGAQPRSKKTPSAGSSELSGARFGFRQILRHTPGVEGLYSKTFGEPSNAKSVIFFEVDDTRWSIRIDDPELFTDREHLKTLVAHWRQRFLFLKPWRVVEAQVAWGNSVIIFQNNSCGDLDEFGEAMLIDDGGTFRAEAQTLKPENDFPYDAFLPPMAGGLTGGSTSLIAPINGISLSEFTLQYLGLFALSSLVRYRPQTWMHAISRSSTADGPADDKALSLIEQFLELTASSIPIMVSTLLNPDEDRFKA